MDGQFALHYRIPDSMSERLSIKLKGIVDHTASWARVLPDGRIELEYYDFSPAAQSHFGNDVAWKYWVDVSEKQRFLARLEQETGRIIPDDQAMLDAIAIRFADTQMVRNWLKHEAIPYQEEFDSWA